MTATDPRPGHVELLPLFLLTPGRRAPPSCSPLARREGLEAAKSGEPYARTGCGIYAPRMGNMTDHDIP